MLIFIGRELFNCGFKDNRFKFIYGVWLDAQAECVNDFETPSYFI